MYQTMYQIKKTPKTKIKKAEKTQKTGLKPRFFGLSDKT